MAPLNENNTSFKCPNCGAAVTFDIKQQKIVCSHCGSEFDTEELKKVNEDLKATEQKEIKWENKTKKLDSKELDGLQVYYCSSCGGNLITDKNTSSTVCPYCGSPVILQDRLEGGLRPNYVLPFKQDKDTIVDTYYKYVRKKLFVKSDFLKRNNLDKFQGLYVPYWLFTSDTEGAATFKGCITTVWSDSDYTYTKRSYYSIYRDGGIAFDHLPHDASKKMDDALLESIEPFTFKNAKDFGLEYLSGHPADKYDVEVKEVEPHVNERMRNTLVDNFRSTIFGYDSVTVTSSSINMLNPVVEYALYPVWYFNSEYKEKKYTFAMNGDSGKMTGNLPCSVWKFIIWFLGWLVVTGGAIFGITFAILGHYEPYIWGIAGGGGLITPLIFCIYHAVALKPVKKAKNASAYTVPDSFHVDHEWSHYLYSTVTRVARPKNNN